MFHSKFPLHHLVPKTFTCLIQFLFTSSFTSSADVSFLMYLILNCPRRLLNTAILQFRYWGKSLATKSKTSSWLKFFLAQVFRNFFSFLSFFQAILFLAILSSLVVWSNKMKIVWGYVQVGMHKWVQATLLVNCVQDGLYIKCK